MDDTKGARRLVPTQAGASLSGSWKGSSRFCGTIPSQKPPARVATDDGDPTWGRFDTAYLRWLSDDAVPEMVRTLPRLSAPLQASVVDEICSRPPRTTKGWAAWNAAHDAPDDARHQVCPAG